MRKIISSKFELDLSSFKLVDTEQNSNMADTMFAKTSYPFEIDLTDELNVSLDFIREYTTRPETIYEVVYSHFDKMEKGTLEIGVKESASLTNLITLKVYEFPFINILWLGIIVMTIGFMMSAYARLKKLKSK